MNAPFLLSQNWAAMSGMHPRSVVWNGCLTGNSGQSMHTSHSFPTPKESSTNTTFLCLNKRGEGFGGGERPGRRPHRVQKQMWPLRIQTSFSPRKRTQPLFQSVPILFPSDRFLQGLLPDAL